MDILPCPFCGNSDIEPSRYDVDMYDGTDAEDARVETVNSYEIVRLNYALPIVGEWSRNQLFFSRQETRIHVPQGSITQGEYDFS